GVGSTTTSGLINTASLTSVKADEKAVAELPTSAAQAVVTLFRTDAGETTVVAVSAEIYLGPVASTIVIASLFIGAFSIGWNIGAVANRQYNEFDYNRRHPAKPSQPIPGEGAFSQLDKETRDTRDDEDEPCGLSSEQDIPRITVLPDGTPITTHTLECTYLCKDGTLFRTKKARKDLWPPKSCSPAALPSEAAPL
ncbi:MAG: hypothetical protein PHS14_12675, partial [Elusimicrobia bacterium]|nr:hypothetical protein [Elusimicrobiota bacterium]